MAGSAGSSQLPLLWHQSVNSAQSPRVRTDRPRRPRYPTGRMDGHPGRTPRRAAGHRRGRQDHARRRTTAGAPHLVAALDQSAGAVLGQLAVASKSNEIPALRDLLTSMNITDAVISADAMHCQRDTANHITGRGGHYILTIKANQPTLRAACKALPWQDVPAVTTTDTSHGRRVRRTIKAVEAPDWIDFTGAAQIIQLRRTRTIKGRKTIEVVYAICSLDMIAAPPATVATWIRGHWAVENALHWVRDVVFDEDRHQLRTGNGPQVMATLSNTTISLIRLAGHTKIATALRHHGRSTSRPIEILLNA